jgi:hypothetical protein
MTFNGIGQYFLVGRNAPAVQETLRKFSVPDNTCFLIDLSYLEKYPVRKRMASYGAVACFSEKRELTDIYVSHWKRWVRKPAAKQDDWDISHKEWEHAKFALKASMGTGMTLKEHLSYAHWIVSNSASIALRECLSRDHPLRRLMHTFVFRSTSVNLASSKTLMPEGLYVHRTAGFTYAGLVEALVDVAKAWQYETFPDFIRGKSLGSVGDQLPLVQDGMRFWNILHNFVRVYLGMYFRNDDDVMNDKEICDFWDTLNSMPSGCDIGQGVAPGFGYGLPRLDSGDGALANLIDCCCHIIFWVTAGHEIVGAVIEYFTTPAGLTTKILDETYEGNKLDKGGQCMADVQTFIQSLSVIALTGYRQPPLISDWARILQIRASDSDAWEDRVTLDDRQAGALSKYFNELRETLDCHDALLAYAGIRRGEKGCESARPMHLHGILSQIQERLDSLTTECHSHTGKVAIHNKILEDIHFAFMHQLTHLTREIEKNNLDRPIAFQSCNPKYLECSVSI